MTTVKKKLVITVKNIKHFVHKGFIKKYGGKTIGLVGPLGSGKTAFVKILAKKLRISQAVTSPTFMLMNKYKFYQNRKALWLFHLDIFRLKSYTEIKALGLEEIWQNKNHLVIIEWANKIKKYLPDNTIFIYFKHLK